MELCSMLCASLDGRRVWERMDTGIYMAESLCYLPETTTTLLIGCIPTQNKKFKVWGKKKEKHHGQEQKSEGKSVWGGMCFILVLS